MGMNELMTKLCRNYTIVSIIELICSDYIFQQLHDFVVDLDMIDMDNNLSA